MIRARRERLVRTYVVTDGRAYPSRNTLDLVTLVSAARHDSLGLNPEQRRVMGLCRGGSLSVAEVAAHLALPVTVVKVLLADLVDSGHILASAPTPPDPVPSPQLLEALLRGLHALPT